MIHKLLELGYQYKSMNASFRYCILSKEGRPNCYVMFKSSQETVNAALALKMPFYSPVPINQIDDHQILIGKEELAKETIA